MKALLRTAARALVALVGLVAPAAAQDESLVQKLTEVPQYSENEVADWLPAAAQNGDPRFRRQVLARFADELDAGRYAGVLRKLADEFRASSWPSHPEVKARFQREMDVVAEAFVEALSKHVPSGEVKTLEQRSQLIAELATTSRRGKESLLPQKRFVSADSEDEVLVFFAAAGGGPPAPEAAEIVTYERVPGAGYRLLVPREAMLDLRLRGDAVAAVFQHFIDQVQDVAAQRIRDADETWRNYLFEGYSQYPWEAALNGWVLDYDTFSPPRSQWIVLHPAIGIEASTVSLDEIQADEVFDVELLGYLRYWGEHGENYLGASLSATLRDDMGPGLGVVAHWTKSFSLGVSWHDLDDDGEWFDDNPYVYMSFDLFRFLQSEGPAFKQKYDSVRELMSTL